MLAQMEPHIRQFSRSDYLSITADAYIQEVIHNIGIDRRLTAYRYIKFMLNYALKHMYITEGLYLHAFAACKIHFEVNDSVLEKSLRDAIDTAYDKEHFNDAFLFLLHYNIHNHKSTNTKFMECAMHYCMQHLKDCLTISKG